jgi:FMN phosphatase YigB (HAD superfamily)
LLALAEGLRLPAREILHVGGSLVEDVFGAKGAGLRTALLERALRAPVDPRSTEWLFRTHGLRPEETPPDLKVRTLEEIPVILDEFG